MSPIDDRIRQKAIIERAASPKVAKEETAPGAHRGNEQREHSDPPASATGPYPPLVTEGPGSMGLPRDKSYKEQTAGEPHGWIAKHGKTWGVIAGMFLAAISIVDIGVRVGTKNSEYATNGALSDARGEIKELRADMAKLTTALAITNQKLDDQKVSDVKPLAEQATKNSLDAQAKADAAARSIATIVRAINGFNAASSRRGQPSPMPLQDP